MDTTPSLRLEGRATQLVPPMQLTRLDNTALRSVTRSVPAFRQ
jgi:hypothetical protein